MSAIEQAGIGAVAGAGYGVVGYFKNRAEDVKFDPVKLSTTIILAGSAGAIVGFTGDNISEANIDATTTALVSVGAAEFVSTGVKAVFRNAKSLFNSPG